VEFIYLVGSNHGKCIALFVNVKLAVAFTHKVCTKR